MWWLSLGSQPVSIRKQLHIKVDSLKKLYISVTALIASAKGAPPLETIPSIVVPDAVLPVAIVPALPGYGEPGYPPVDFPGTYLEIPPGISLSDTSICWYTITVGLCIGVFAHW